MTATIALPVLSCTGCGACCTHMATPPLFAAFFPPKGKKTPAFMRGTPDEAIVASMPGPIRRRVRAGFRDAWATNRSTFAVPCFAYDEKTRRCTIYEYRPTTCREFEIGGDGCLNNRRRERIP